MVEDTKIEIETENFIQMVEGPTHFWPGHVDSLIDQSWGNKPENYISCKNITRSTADHNLIQTIYRTKGSNKGAQEIIKRSRKNFKIDDYKKFMSEIDWTSLYSTDDVNIANDILENKILSVLDSVAPICKVQPKRNATSWISDETKKMHDFERSHKRDSQQIKEK